jgi:hypothetical protein
MYKYPDTLGYINNKKGISSVTTGGETICYILSTREHSTGKQLVIRTTKNYEGNIVERQTIVPILPYRIMFNDPNFFNNIKKDLYPHNEALNLFNPGIVFTSNSVTMPAQFNSQTTNFIELNIPRSCLNLFTKYDYIQQQADGTIFTTTMDIKAYDIQASMVVEANGTHDNLFISLSSRIDALNYNGDRINWSWTIPVVIMLKVLRSNINSSTIKEFELLPTSWSYPIDLDWFAQNNPKTTIAKINDIAGSPTDNLWNYNMIPGQYVLDRGGNHRYMFTNYGCVTDIDYTESSGIVCFSSIGNYFPSQERYNQIHTLSKILFSTGFVQPSITNAKVFTNNVVSNNCVYKIENYYVSVANEYTKTSNGVSLIIYDNSLNIVNQRKFGGWAHFSDLIEKDNVLYILYYTDTKRYIFKFPTIDSSFISLIGNGSINVIGMTNIFKTSGMTLIKESNISQLSQTFIDYTISLPNGATQINNIDISCPDKSIISNLKNSFPGVLNTLKLIGTSCLVIDKINLSINGQTNNLEYLSV